MSDLRRRSAPLARGLLLAVLAGLAAGAVPGQDAGPEEYFRRVRKAVTDEDSEALYQLARLDSWSFREVTHQLADLALEQAGSEVESESVEGYARLVVAGHLATVYMQITGDATLADRLRLMRLWTPEDIRAHVESGQLLAAASHGELAPPRRMDRALATCERLEDLRCVGLLHGALGQTAEQAGQAAAALSHYEKAATALRSAGELPRLRDALLARGSLLLEQGRPAQAASDLGAAAAVGEQIGDAAGQASALLLVAEALRADGRKEQAMTALTTARDVALEGGVPLLAARAILARTALRDAGGAGQASAADYEAGARLAEQGGDRALVAEAYMVAARIHDDFGEDASASEAVERAISASRLAGLNREMAPMLLLAGDLHARLGDTERALRRLEEATRRYRDAEDPIGEARALEQTAATLLEAGRIEEARQPLLQAQRLAAATGEVGLEGRIEGGLGAVALSTGDLQGAREHYRRSVDLLGRAGDRFQEARMRHMVEEISRRLEAGGSGG